MSPLDPSQSAPDSAQIERLTARILSLEADASAASMQFETQLAALTRQVETALALLDNISGQGGITVFKSDSNIVIKAPPAADPVSRSSGSDGAGGFAGPGGTTIAPPYMNTTTGAINVFDPNGNLVASGFSAVRSGFTYTELTVCNAGVESTVWIPTYSANPS